MINKHMIGRLGNQMFQYATVRAFQLRNNLTDEEINLNFDEVLARAKEGEFEDSLKYFNITEYKTTKIKKSFIQLVLLGYLDCIKAYYIFKDKLLKTNNYSKIMYQKEKKIQPLLNRHGLYSFRLGYYPFENCSCKNKIFYGTFESAKYFDDYKEILRNEFTPKKGILTKNKTIYKQIENSESVCVSIRRGDFVSVESIKKNLYICTPKYFETAIKEMSKRVPNARFFIFSDDIDWVKKNMKFPANSVYESGDDPVYEKLRMMYSCKHFILSNSTFSWWCQYLSKNEKKIVIAPNRWTNDSYKENGEFIDIYMDDFILIDVDRGVLWQK